MFDGNQAHRIRSPAKDCCTTARVFSSMRFEGFTSASGCVAPILDLNLGTVALGRTLQAAVPVPAAPNPGPPQPRSLVRWLGCAGFCAPCLEHCRSGVWICWCSEQCVTCRPPCISDPPRHMAGSASAVAVLDAEQKKTAHVHPVKHELQCHGSCGCQQPRPIVHHRPWRLHGGRTMGSRQVRRLSDGGGATDLET